MLTLVCVFGGGEEGVGIESVENIVGKKTVILNDKSENASLHTCYLQVIKFHRFV